MKKKIIFVLFCIVLLFVPDRYVLAQDTDLQAPTVQYKLNNHDSISLKWDSIDGADAYYIYRKDTKAGKKVRYTKPVYDTEITINNLSAETEYIFSVAPIKKNGNKVIVGKASSGTKLTTPKEWYYYDDSKIDTEKKKIKSDFYRTDYAKTIKQKINLGDIKYVEAITYYDGWYYVIGNLDAIDSKPYPWGHVSNQMCIARIREDGTQKEILYKEFYDSENVFYEYMITDEMIILQQICYRSINEKGKWRFIYDAELCWLKKLILKNGEVKTIKSSCLYNWFYYFKGYIYYGYDDIYTFSKESDYLSSHQGVYISEWFDSKYGKFENSEKHKTYYCRMTDDGDKTKVIYKSEFDGIINNSQITDYIMAVTNEKSIFILSIQDLTKEKIYESASFIVELSVDNDYIYFTELEKPESNEMYCRIKNDGTGLEKQDKPFEWFY